MPDSPDDDQLDFAEIDCLFRQMKRLDIVCGGALKLRRAQEKDLNWNAADSAEQPDAWPIHRRLVGNRAASWFTHGESEAIVPAPLVALDASVVVERSSSGEGRVGWVASPAKDEADEYEEEERT